MNRPQRAVSPVAIAQLSAWEMVAREWPINFVPHDDAWHAHCAVCGTTITPLADYRGSGYWISIDIMLAAMVAHLRNVHRDIEGEVYKGDPINGSENTKPASGTGIASSDDSGNTDPD